MCVWIIDKMCAAIWFCAEAGNPHRSISRAGQRDSALQGKSNDWRSFKKKRGADAPQKARKSKSQAKAERRSWAVSMNIFILLCPSSWCGPFTLIIWFCQNLLIGVTKVSCQMHDSIMRRNGVIHKWDGGITLPNKNGAEELLSGFKYIQLCIITGRLGIFLQPIPNRKIFFEHPPMPKYSC